VNVAFTILEVGQQATSVVGNHSIAILKVSEKCDNLASALEDIISEAKDSEVVTVEENSVIPRWRLEVFSLCGVCYMSICMYMVQVSKRKAVEHVCNLVAC
jgi:hypothetical protein